MGEILQKITAEAGQGGAITFARFMELALYCPDCGYYEREKETIGRGGDFFTSVSVGPLFGRLLAVQISEWVLEDTPGCQESSRPLLLLEAGAHRGDLARDILEHLQQFDPGTYKRIEYCIIEPSPTRRSWQAMNLSKFHGKIRWATDITQLNLSTTFCILIANELLDAFPVHRLAWNSKERQWFECGVGLQGDGLTWVSLPFNPDLWEAEDLLVGSDGDLDLRALPPTLADVLPDGFIVEISPAASRWWKTAVSRIPSGRMCAFDYGYLACEFLTPERCGGTLRAYRGHKQVSDLLAFPGQQDITAHVNFSAIRRVGENAGAVTQEIVTQEKFLNRVAERILTRGIPFPPWTQVMLRQFRTLSHPAHLGASFKVILQKRG